VAFSKYNYARRLLFAANLADYWPPSAIPHYTDGGNILCKFTENFGHKPIEHRGIIRQSESRRKRAPYN